MVFKQLLMHRVEDNYASVGGVATLENRLCSLDNIQPQGAGKTHSRGIN